MGERIDITEEMRNRMNITVAVALIKNLQQKDMIKQRTFDDIFDEAKKRIDEKDKS